MRREYPNTTLILESMKYYNTCNTFMWRLLSGAAGLLCWPVLRAVACCSVTYNPLSSVQLSD